jgi:hypothetical protein
MVNKNPQESKKMPYFTPGSAIFPCHISARFYCPKRHGDLTAAGPDRGRDGFVNKISKIGPFPAENGIGKAK